MTIWQAFLLGCIQGITEFLPVSSSGHLALGQYFLGLEHDYLLFNLICHLGTLVAIFYVFFPAIKENLTHSGFWQVLIGTLPLFPLVLIMKPIKALLNHPELLGPCFLVSACLLFASLRWQLPLRKKRWQDSLTIGISQAIAIFPGISRSGATISVACLLGWQKQEAIQFSFLLAIPTILGASFFEAWQHASNFSLIDPWVFSIGFCTSFIVGCCSLWLLKTISNKWIYFAWYCLLLGIITTVYFNYGI